MLLLALLLAAAPPVAPTPTPAPTVRPAPVLGRTAQGARAKSLADHAAEMKAKGGGAQRVSFEDVRVVEPDELEDPAPGERARPKGAGGGGGGAADEAAASTSAQRRMDRAVERGLAVPERCSTARRDRARREWDDAAEACRRTPGCVPRYRDDPSWGANKPLRTDQELIEEIRKRGFSEPHPMPTRK